MPATVYELKFVQQSLNFCLIAVFILSHLECALRPAEEGFELGHLKASCGETRILRIENIFDGGFSLHLWRVVIALDRHGFIRTVHGGGKEQF